MASSVLRTLPPPLPAGSTGRSFPCTHLEANTSKKHISRRLDSTVIGLASVDRCEQPGSCQLTVNNKGTTTIMRARKSLRIRRRWPAFLLALTVIGGAALPSHADVITDWDAKASAAASPAALGERELAIVDIAMFDAVNSIYSKYRPYLVKEGGYSDASAEAAAASAAASALEKLHPQSRRVQGGARGLPERLAGLAL